jgi:clan AA aspartic protease
MRNVDMMRIPGANKMGRFAVEFEVANFADVANAREGILQPDKVRRQTISGVVDSGATQLVLPLSVVKRLGLRSTGKVKVRYADQRTALRDMVEGVYVEILDRHCDLVAIVEPRRRSALIGALVLESLDLLIDCTNRRLVPRDPRYVISEIE